MKLWKFLDLYDNWNGTVVINNNNLVEIARGTGREIYHNPKVSDLPVLSFGFYDNELCIRVGDSRGI